MRDLAEALLKKDPVIELIFDSFYVRLTDTGEALGEIADAIERELYRYVSEREAV